ncbi:hypothetical protein AAES_33925 [Amazona aestiva]|uniref:Uncharacterized protein n=1 Tax=Amazona aestiva TaxID=12930 RepID=A0A0Q3P3I5_AMAAE|nr:hypothetical protein AAES_33925 [Amazona aestiva]
MHVTEHELPQQWLGQFHKRDSVQEQNRINDNEESRQNQNFHCNIFVINDEKSNNLRMEMEPILTAETGKPENSLEQITRPSNKPILQNSEITRDLPHLGSTTPDEAEENSLAPPEDGKRKERYCKEIDSSSFQSTFKAGDHKWGKEKWAKCLWQW